jgi:hypothetical protein
MNLFMYGLKSNTIALEVVAIMHHFAPLL